MTTVALKFDYFDEIISNEKVNLFTKWHLYF